MTETLIDYRHGFDEKDRQRAAELYNQAFGGKFASAIPPEERRVDYPTAEHWMMAGKARLFGDEDALRRIVVAPDPKSAKAIGREVRGFDDKVWKANCRQIVTEGNLYKFSQNEELKAFLLSTGDAVIVEAAPRDQIWA